MCSEFQNLGDFFTEPFLESLPQVYMVMVIAFILDFEDRLQSGCIARPLDRRTGPPDSLSVVTFVTSIVTASFGIAKFVKSGPARIVRNDKCLMGYGTLSFILIFINVLTTVFMKAGAISILLQSVWQKGTKAYSLLILICFIPQLLHVS